MLHRLKDLARNTTIVLALGLSCGYAIAAPGTELVAERIDFIRHGESEDNPDKGKTVSRLDGTLGVSKGKVLSGWNSASLTMLGVSQAVKAGEVLAQKDAAVSTKLRDALWLYSPLLRTRQTLSGVLIGAKLTADGDVRARPDTRLFERSAGDVTNLTWDEAAKIWPEMQKGRSAAVFNQVSAAYPNGESLEIVYRRASSALDEAMRTEKRIVIVSHELTIKAMVAYLTLGKIDERAFAISVENAKPISLVRKGNQWEVAAQP